MIFCHHNPCDFVIQLITSERGNYFVVHSVQSTMTYACKCLSSPGLLAIFIMSCESLYKDLFVAWKIVKQGQIQDFFLVLVHYIYPFCVNHVKDKIIKNVFSKCSTIFISKPLCKQWVVCNRILLDTNFHGTPGCINLLILVDFWCKFTWVCDHLNFGRCTCTHSTPNPLPSLRGSAYVVLFTDTLKLPIFQVKYRPLVWSVITLTYEVSKKLFLYTTTKPQKYNCQGKMLTTWLCSSKFLLLSMFSTDTPAKRSR